MPSVRTERPGAVVAALALAATVLVTWDLWSPRPGPPVLPVVDLLGGWPWGPGLLVLCALAIWRPGLGAVACGVGLVGALLGDQVRWQPEVVSLGLLVVVLTLGEPGRAIGRWHLGTMWLWAGLHKALSLNWSLGGAAFIADSLHRPGLRWVIALAVPATEIGLGLASFVPRLWRLVRWGAVALHVGILITLSPRFADWNEAVWPWNAALAVVGWRLFRREDPAPDLVPNRVVGAVGLVLLATPALFYVGSIDAYFAHNLYSSNTPSATVCVVDGGCRVEDFDSVDELRVPFPPQPRLFRRAFDPSCAPDEVLVIIGRATRFDDPPSRTEHPCPGGDA